MNQNNLLVVGDLHLADKIPGYLDAQVSYIIKLGAYYERIVFLGDVFDKRKPTPTELLGCNRMLNSLYNTTEITIVRGNHDTETKSRDGVTALTLFESEFVTVCREHVVQGAANFIPHYEDENIIKDILKNVSRDSIIFGHFGYDGCINSTGSYDFTISPDLIPCDAYLGHIHTYSNRKNITIVGTPYTTGFGESSKDCYVVELDKDDKPIIRPSKGGIRHITTSLDKLSSMRDTINDDKYFTLLRVILPDIKDTDINEFREEILRAYNIKFLDIKFTPRYLEQLTSEYKPARPLSLINDGIIHKYIEGSNTAIPKDRLIEGLNELKKDNN